MLQALFQSAIPVDPLLITIALIIFVGYLGEAVFSRTKLPEVLILMFIGLLLGPVSQLVPQSYVLFLRTLAPLFGTLALVTIMFNAGKTMRFKEKHSSGAGILIAFADVAAPGIIIALVMYYLFGWPLLYGALLGVILGETSTIMVLPVIRKLKIGQWFYNMEVTETTFNSVFAILAFYLLLIIIQGGVFSVSSYVEYTLSYISIAVFIGMIAGFGWLLVRNVIQGASGYLATIAIAILVYGIVDLLNAAAIVSVLIFAVLIGNAKTLNRYLNLKDKIKTRESKDVEKSLEFLLKTFFFVFIGIITVLSLTYFIYGLVIVVILILFRYAQVYGMLRGAESKYRNLFLALLPRGLTVAVLSSTLLSLGGLYNDEIFYICSMMLILTNIAFALLTSRNASKF